MRRRKGPGALEVEKRDDFFFFPTFLHLSLASLVAQTVKNQPAMQETPVRFLGREDLLEKG